MPITLTGVAVPCWSLGPIRLEIFYRDGVTRWDGIVSRSSQLQLTWVLSKCPPLGGEQTAAVAARRAPPLPAHKRADLVVHAPDGPRIVIDVGVVHSDVQGHAMRDVQRQEQTQARHAWRKSSMLARPPWEDGIRIDACNLLGVVESQGADGEGVPVSNRRRRHGG